MSESPCILLTDNGSYRPEATQSLRRLAQELSDRSGHSVNPVSLLHSTKISPGKLGGIPAETFEPYLIKKREELGLNSFLVVPLFFGPSAAIAEYIPQRVEAIREEHDWPDLEVRVAPCLVNRHDVNDFRVAHMLADLITKKRNELSTDEVSVAVVDHGAPRIEVTKVRNFLAEQLKRLCEDSFQAIAPCSMERREGAAYDFNEPLLECLLGSEGFQKEVIVSMLFLQPGRHAGPGGDVAQICQDAEAAHPGLKAHMTDLVGTQPALIDLLAERLAAGLDSAPVSWR